MAKEPQFPNSPGSVPQPGIEPSPLPPSKRKGYQLQAQFGQWLATLQQRWTQVATAARSRLPWIANWSDTTLLAVVAGILVVGLILVLQGGSGAPPAPAMEPKTRELPAMAQGDEAAAVESVGNREEPEPAIAPAPVAAPGSQPPDPIRDIQAQLTAVAALYGENLVQSVQVNLAQARLTTNLSTDWYQLNGDAQGDLVADLQRRAQALTFSTLEVRSPDGDLLARSPVVGDTMVILQRQLPPGVPTPERPHYRIILDP